MFMRLVDIYWYVVPNFAHERGHFYFSIWYLVAPIGLGGLWLACFFYNLRQRPLLPRTSRRCRACCTKDRDMATNDDNYDPLRNPQVDYERTDLSARGILMFLVGLLVAGIFIELVIWGMFRFMARTEALFPQPQLNPMRRAEQAQKAQPGPRHALVLQNSPAVNLNVFPEPRLQSHDAGEMSRFLQSEQALLNVKQPFADPSGAIHIPISLAMQVIVERGLPVRPNAPPPEINTQTAAGNTKMLDMQPGPLGPGAAAGNGNKAAGGEQKQP